MNAGDAGREVDIAIVGGGLVGASLACALAPLGFEVAVLESVPLQAAAQPSYDDRALALNHVSCRILQGLGIWEGLRRQATPIREVVVTECGRPGRVEIRASEMRLPALGHVVEARVFGQVVMERLAALPNVHVHCPVELTGIRIGDESVSLEGGDGVFARGLGTRLLVAADGARSTVRGLLQVPAQECDYGQTAVICNITTGKPHGGRAFERLAAAGPIAVLPHTAGRCGLVWTVGGHSSPRLMEMPQDRFLAEARRRFGAELGDFLKVGERGAYPLRLVRAQRDVYPRTVILGNAAHAIHPIGAQGFNLGLRDVAALAEVLALSSSPDPGHAGALQEYSAWRRPDHERTISWSHGMARLFASPAPAAAAVRSLGLLAHAAFPVLRRRMATGMMGYRGRVPRLASGRPLHPPSR